MAKILLVEDDRFTRELYEALLKDAGHQVETASEGESGLTLAVKGGYDLILLDIMLPNKDGITLLKELKEIKPQKPNKKVVMLTVLDQDEFVQSALRLGADGYLMKAALTPDSALEQIGSFLKEE